MPDETDELIEPEDVNSSPAKAISPNDPARVQADGSSAAENPPLDPNDEIPVPIAMEPAEIDERAQVVEALRGRKSDADATAEDPEARA